MKRFAKILALVLLVVAASIFMKPAAVCAAASACKNPESNPNKLGLMLNMHYEDFDQAAKLVGKGGWVVELAFTSAGLTIQDQLSSHPDTNLVIWGMPGDASQATADAWCATLGKLDTAGRKIFFKPWNTANVNNPDPFAVPGTPSQVADYQKNLYSCLKRSGLLDNKVVLLSPVLSTGDDVKFNYKEYFDALDNPELKKNVARSLYDVREGGAACTAADPKDNACKTAAFANSVGGKYTYAVEAGTADPGKITYEDAKMAELIRRVGDPSKPGNWVTDNNFIMGALYTRDPDTHEVWNIWKNGKNTQAAYREWATNGCVNQIGNQSEIDKKFAPWFESIKTLIVPCDNFGYAAKKELCDAPLKFGTPKSGEFPPLGTLQSCPKEIPVIRTNNKVLTPAANGARCGIEPKEDPDVCRNPEKYVDSTGKVSDKNHDDVCLPAGENSLYWCRPDTVKKNKEKFDKIKFRCGDDHDATMKRFSVALDVFCNGNGSKPAGYDLWQKIFNGIKSGVCVPLSEIPPNNLEDARKCLDYELKTNSSLSTPNPVPSQSLPACVPTTYAFKPYPNNNAPAQCVSECSEPLDIAQNVSLTTVGNCNKVNGGTCNAKIKIQEKTFTLPIAKDLAGYFTGILDAEQSSPDMLKKAYQDTQTMMAKSGVAKKLLPSEIQDQLKCQFLKDTIKKIANKENTKYAFTQNGKPEVFQIDGIPITQFLSMGMPPYFDNSPNTDCARKPASQTEITDWAINSYGSAWKNVPLFANEDAQGEIQFVSPSLFSIEPIQVSIPEVNRLNSATSLLQSLLVPKGLQEIKVPSKTYGKTISFNNSDNVCRPTPVWENYYSGADYNRAVLCKISPTPVSGAPDSQVCVLDPKGVINCQRQDPSLTRAVVDQDPETKVQVRTIFPGFYDIAEQTISQFTGLLRIFKPQAVNKMVSDGLASTKQEAADEFERNFAPDPVQSDPINYEVTVSNTLQLKPKEGGWKIFFYKLGGVFNARNFVLELLNPGLKK